MRRLLTYPEVKAIFGWKSTTSIRRYIRSGDLVRVHIGHGMNTFRITEESAQAFIERLKSKYEQDAYAERAAKHTEHMRAIAPAPLPEPEVLLDAEEITRQSRLRAPEPKAKPKLDDYLAEKRDAETPAPRPVRSSGGLGFRNMRGI
jgi:hypothetical protein